MEIIFLNQELEDPNSRFMNLDLNNYFTHLEDFVFILSIVEWQECTGLLNALCEQLIHVKDRMIGTKIIEQFQIENGQKPLSIISILFIYTWRKDNYQMKCLNTEVPGGCYAVFIVKKEQAMQRTEEVKRKIQETRDQYRPNSISLN